MGAMHSVISSSSYEEAVRKVIMAGGCNCSRANLAGACLGAAYGFGGDRGIRLDWLEKTTKAVDVLDLAISKLS
jgi:ADP-ribosylglycohydrolase